MNHYETADGKIVVDVMKFDVAPLFPLPDGSAVEQRTPQAHLFRWTFDPAGTGQHLQGGTARRPRRRVPALRRALLHERLPPRLDRLGQRRRHRDRRAATGRHRPLRPEDRQERALGGRRRRPLRRADLRAARSGRRRGRRLGADRGLSRRREALATSRCSRRPTSPRDRWRWPISPARCRPASTATGGPVLFRSHPPRLRRGGEPGECRDDHRPSPQELALAARAVDAGGARPRLRGQALQARADDAGTGLAARHSSAGQVAGHHRRRQDPGRIRRHPGVSGRDLRQRPLRAGGGLAGEAALHLLPALRRRLADAASVHEAGVRPPARTGAEADAAGGAR